MSLTGHSVAPETAVAKFAMHSTKHHPFTFSHRYLFALCTTLDAVSRKRFQDGHEYIVWGVATTIRSCDYPEIAVQSSTG